MCLVDVQFNDVSFLYTQQVFNNIFYMSLQALGKPKGAAGRVALPVAGDNAAHKQAVFELLELLGFDGVDAGPLSESWRQEPGQPCYCTDYDAPTLRAKLAAAYTDKQKKWAKRDEMLALFSLAAKSREEFIGAVRAIHESKSWIVAKRSGSSDADYEAARQAAGSRRLRVRSFWMCKTFTEFNRSR